jgi:hypothetical protein
MTKTFTDYMRDADILQLPDLREGYIELNLRLWDNEKPPCCAVGGANLAAGVNLGITSDDTVLEGGRALMVGVQPSWILKLSEPCPECVVDAFSIIHMYDDHEWSRTKIADYLDDTFGRNHSENDFIEHVIGTQ